MKKKEIKIPEEMYFKLEKRAKDSDFEDVDSYVEFILLQVIERIENEQDDEELSEEDEERIKQRLKSLGYL
ncbi:CopG family transcriptional regulator [Candidatus Woesearchaeota archaeon]|nr:CopG family transcriptional regulator [Candidatus Woesearchaeota archaeon]